jgi:hypothetical protein
MEGSCYSNYHMVDNPIQYLMGGGPPLWPLHPTHHRAGGDSDSMSSFSLPSDAPIVASSVPSYVRVLVASRSYQTPVLSPGQSVTSHLNTGHHADVLSQVIWYMEDHSPLVAPAPAQAQAPGTHSPPSPRPISFPSGS